MRSKKIFLFIFYIIVFCSANTSAQVAGEIRTSANKLQFHDGTAWIDTVTNAGSGACSVSGEIKYVSPRIEYCDGANWKSTDSAVNDVTCTGTGQIRYNTTDSELEFCNGTNWRKMVLKLKF